MVSVPLSTPKHVRRLLVHADIDDVEPTAPQAVVVESVVSALRDGRTIILPMRTGSHLAHLLGSGLLTVAILVGGVLHIAFENPWLAALWAASLAPFLLFHLVVALPRSGELRLDLRGMTVRYAFRERTWNWSELDSFAVNTVGDDAIPRVGFNTSRPEDTATDLLNYLGVRGLTLTTRIPDDYGLTQRALAVLLRGCRTACARRSAPTLPREVGSTTTARLLNASGGAAALLAFSCFAVLWVAPSEPVVVLVICAIMAVVFGGLYWWMRARRR